MSVDSPIPELVAAWEALRLRQRRTGQIAGQATAAVTQGDWRLARQLVAGGREPGLRRELLDLQAAQLDLAARMSAVLLLDGPENPEAAALLTGALHELERAGGMNQQALTVAHVAALAAERALADEDGEAFAELVAGIEPDVSGVES